MKFTVNDMRNNFQNIIKENIINIERQESAYSNHVYIIETSESKYIYKQYICESIVDKDLEINIQKQIGYPPIIHSSKNFRIEEYMTHTKVSWDKDFAKIAKELRKFHEIKIKCDFTHETMLQNILNQNKDIKDNHIVIKILTYIQKLLKSNNNISLCHNDLQIGNMIKIDDDIKFIDFEYTCMGNPLIDIANLFCETMCDYDNDSILKKQRGFSDKTKKHFLSIYSEDNNADDLLLKVSKAEAFCHFYWFLWGRNLHITKTGPSTGFRYDLYSNNRLGFLVELRIITDEDYNFLKI